MGSKVPRMDRIRAGMILQIVKGYHGLDPGCSVAEWVALKLGCSTVEAGQQIDKAKAKLGADWQDGAPAPTPLDVTALVITEGTAGTHYYHLSDPANGGRGLCGAMTMSTRLPVATWGMVTHLGER